GDGEVRAVAGRLVVAVPRGGHHVLAVEGRAQVVDRDRAPRTDLRVAPGGPLELRRRAGDLLRERLRRGVDLGLGPVGHVRGDVDRVAERLGQIRRGDPGPGQLRRAGL